MRLFPSLLLPSLLTVLAVACAAPAETEGDVGDEEQGSTESLAKSSGSCNLTKQQILAAVSGGRRTAISRGFEWFADGVPYSQSASHEGYRTDCSGFVSMCWQLGQSYTTADFAGGSSKWKSLSSYEALVPGDALVRRSGGSGHAVLFVGWNDAAHSGACVLEEASTASDMQFHVRSVSSLKGSGFKAIAATKLVGTGGASAAPAATPDEDEDTALDQDEDAPAPTSKSTSGAACASDGACNPGNDGSGKICVSGRCVSGCRSDAHCPGMTVCVAGQCK